MKIQTSMLNAVRIEADDDTKLLFHTGNVKPDLPLVVQSSVGDRLFLRKGNERSDNPIINAPTPYGAGSSEMLAFQFGRDSDLNFLTTAATENPDAPSFIPDLAASFRMSMFLKPEVASTAGAQVLIAGVPGMFGLYQQDASLMLVLWSGGVAYTNVLSYPLEAGAWNLLDVQWQNTSLYSGWPMWYVNGVAYPSSGVGLETSTLDLDGDRFNVAWDNLTDTGYWRGVVRELELSSVVILDDVPGPDPDSPNGKIYARAMRLFGLATETTARRTFDPPFSRSPDLSEPLGAFIQPCPRPANPITPSEPAYHEYAMRQSIGSRAVRGQTMPEPRC